MGELTLTDKAIAWNKKSSFTKEEEKLLNRERKEFLNKFSKARMSSLTLEDYAIQTGKDESKDSFCYWVERRLDKHGRILGATASKFGVYYGKKKNEGNKLDWRWTNWTGSNFDNIKNELIALLEAGQKQDYVAIKKNKLSNMFKWKILSLYFPNQYLNIYSNEHIQEFLRVVFNDYRAYSLEEAKEKLFEHKNENEVMKKWSNVRYMYFLYEMFPEVKYMDIKAIKEENIDISKFRFKVCSGGSYTALQKNSKKGNSFAQKIDYVAKEKELIQIGHIGESVVLSYEKENLISVGKKKLANKVKWISEKDDTAGYDIRSFDENGNEKHIEVKTSKSSRREVSFFLSANEYEKMQSDSLYQLYYVCCDFKNKNGLIMKIDCKQLCDRFNKFAVPTNYRVTFEVNGLEEGK